MSSVDLDECMKVALELVRSAGEVVKENIYKKKTIETKLSAADLVTETDKKVEELLIGSLKKKFPDHRFIGEESVSAGEKCNWTDAPTWIIDPVDGTMNFVHGFPYVSISVALTVKKQVELGIVYGPVLGQMFSARRGQGAFLNGTTKLEVSHQTDVAQGLIFGEFGGDTSEEKKRVLVANLSSLFGKVHNVRGMGSAALNMSYTAAGWADAYYEFGIHCWDIAAGALLIEEAGGVNMDTTGGPFDLMSRRMICASSAELGQGLSKLLTHMTYERDV